jgi:hypothetical protein
VRGFISKLLISTLACSLFQFATPFANATDTFENSITSNLTNLIEKIDGECLDPAESKKVRINDAIEKISSENVARLYLLWTYTCNYDLPATIMLSIRQDSAWSSYEVASYRKIYIDRNYLGAPNFIDLHDSGVGVVWADQTENPGIPKLVGKMFDGQNPSAIAGSPLVTIAESIDCKIGNILPVVSQSESFLLYLTNNGGGRSCMGELYLTKYQDGLWTEPTMINPSEEASDIDRYNNLSFGNYGTAYICFTTRIGTDITSNQVSVITLREGEVLDVFTKTYPDINVNSAHYCSVKIDQNNAPHLLIAETAWIDTSDVENAETAISVDVETVNFMEMKKNGDTWEELPGSLDVVNSQLDGSFTYAKFCDQCNEKLNLIVTSESNKIRIYEYGSDGNWSKTRDFNEGYSQSVQNIQEVWGSSTTGYTFLINNYAEELQGPYDWQKGHFLDIQPTFSPPSVNQLLFSDSISGKASEIFSNEFGSIDGRFTSRSVFKYGNSIFSMWEDLGSEGNPPGTVIIESIVKENPSCTDSNFAPGKPIELVASSVYTTAILNFVRSQCGTSQTRAIVEVSNITSGITSEVVLTTNQLELRIPNLEAGSTYAFKVKLANNYGSSKFTSLSNLVVATRPSISVPIEQTLPNQEKTDVTDSSKPEVISQKDKEGKLNDIPSLLFNKDKTIQLNSLGVVFADIKTNTSVKNNSSISINSSADATRARVVNVLSNKSVEMSIKVPTKERLKTQLIVGKKIIQLGDVLPSSKSVLKLPSVKFKSGKYLFKFTTPDGKNLFVSVRAK